MFRSRKQGWFMADLIKLLDGRYRESELLAHKYDDDRLRQIARMYYDLVDLCDAAPFDAARARADIAATWARIEREWPK